MKAQDRNTNTDMHQINRGQTPGALETPDHREGDTAHLPDEVQAGHCLVFLVSEAVWPFPVSSLFYAPLLGPHEASWPCCLPSCAILVAWPGLPSPCVPSKSSSGADARGRLMGSEKSHQSFWALPCSPPIPLPLSFLTTWWGCLGPQSCCTGHYWAVSNRNVTTSHFWSQSLELRCCQGWSLLRPLLALQVAAFSLCPHTVFPVCVFISMSRLPLQLRPPVMG